jgi:hypothetical protein
MVEYVEVPLPEDFPSRLIKVEDLQIGDIVQPGVEPQTVRDIEILDGGKVKVRLSAEQPRFVTGMVWPLVRRKGEKEEE